MCYINSKMKDLIVFLNKNVLTSSFTAPEQLCIPQMKALISKMKEKNTLARIVVDEAHCVDIWGI